MFTPLKNWHAATKIDHHAENHGNKSNSSLKIGANILITQQKFRKYKWIGYDFSKVRAFVWNLKLVPTGIYLISDAAESEFHVLQLN